MAKYKIIDKQGVGTHSDDVFSSKEEVRQHLISYHSVDFTGETPLEDYSLEQILEYGEWEIEKY